MNDWMTFIKWGHLDPTFRLNIMFSVRLTGGRMAGRHQHTGTASYDIKGMNDTINNVIES